MSDYKLTLKDYAMKNLGKISNKLGFSCEGCQDSVSVESVLGLTTSAVTTAATYNIKYDFAAGSFDVLNLLHRQTSDWKLS